MNNNNDLSNSEVLKIRTIALEKVIKIWLPKFIDPKILILKSSLLTKFWR